MIPTMRHGWYRCRTSRPYNVCLLGMFRTQPRHTRAALLPRDPLHPQKRIAWQCCLRRSSGAGLRPVLNERTDFVEGDLLVLPAKRRRSPRPATQNVPLLSE
jgi:hypothetical protein